MTDRPQRSTFEPLAGLEPKLRSQLRRGEQPTRIEPQLASAAGGSPGPDWVYERKFDGVRLLAFVRDGEVRLRTRKHVPVDDAFPELTEALRTSAHANLVVDGEAVARDGDTRSLSRLQGRLGLGLTQRARPRPNPGRGPYSGQDRRVPVHLYIFDLLSIDGHDLRQRPLRARKRLLSGALGWNDPLRYSEHRTGDRDELFEDACRSGW